MYEVQVRRNGSLIDTKKFDTSGGAAMFIMKERDKMYLAGVVNRDDEHRDMLALENVLSLSQDIRGLCRDGEQFNWCVCNITFGVSRVLEGETA